jgi:intracellular septation protein
MRPWLKLLIEVGPLVVFFGVYAKFDLMVATAAFMVAIAIALGASIWIERRVPIMPLVSAAVVMVFGGLTLWLDDATFIKMKPTIIYVLFAGVLLGGLAFGKSFLGYVLDAVFRLSDEGWRILTLRWALFFLALAVVNEIVWRSLSTNAWVAFKVFAVLPITFVFALIQMPLINRHSLPEEDEAERR